MSARSITGVAADLVSLAGITGLRGRYEEPWRHYHSWAHPIAMLEHLGRAELDGVSIADREAAVGFVLWHDAIYDPEASGIKVGQIYRDFASKEDIIAAIAARDLTRFLDEAALDHAIRVGDIAGIRAWILTFVSYSDDFEGYRLMPEIMAESARNPRVATVLGILNDQIQNTLLTALAACAPG